MDKHAMKIVVNIFKYIAIVILIFSILFNTDIPSNLCSGEFKNFLQSFTNLMRINMQTTSILLFICVIVILVCNIINNFIKSYDENHELDKIYTESINRIDRCKAKYTNLAEKTTKIEDNLNEAKEQLSKETYSKIFKLSNNCNRIEAHFERRKSNYFVTNQKFYEVVKTSKNIDNDTLQLINTFENEIFK